MRQMITGVRWARGPAAEERGAAAVEYALIVAGVAVVVLFGIQVFGALLDAEWASFTSWLAA